MLGWNIVYGFNDSDFEVCKFNDVNLKNTESPNVTISIFRHVSFTACAYADRASVSKYSYMY